jgi:uncharacterized protein DUF6353
MAPLGSLAKRFERLIIDNSPVILTAIGVTGALTTAYLTGRASFRASDLIFEETMRINKKTGIEDDPELLTAKEKIRLVWKLYIPPAVTGSLTIAAIISANQIGSRRAAALAAAYAISEKAFDEYRSKVVEKIGEKREQTVRDEIAQDRVNRMPVVDREVIVTGNGSVLCQDAFSGRYFLSDMETLRTAENDINYRVIHDSYASLSDFYELIGLPSTSVSDDVGWNLDKLLELKFSATLTEAAKKPCICVDFKVAPVRHYNRLS